MDNNNTLCSKMIPTATGNVRFVADIHDDYVRLTAYENEKGGEISVAKFSIPMDASELTSLRDLLNSAIDRLDA